MRRHYPFFALVLRVLSPAACNAADTLSHDAATPDLLRTSKPWEQDPKLVLEEVRRLQEPLESVALRLRVLVDQKNGEEPPPPVGPTTVKVEGLDERLAALQNAADSLVVVANELRQQSPEAVERIHEEIERAAVALEHLGHDVAAIRRRVAPSGSSREHEHLARTLDAILGELQRRRRTESFIGLARTIAEELRRALGEIERGPRTPVDLTAVEQLLQRIAADVSRFPNERAPMPAHFARVLGLLESAVDAMQKIERRLAVHRAAREPREPQAQERLRPVIERAVEQLRAELADLKGSVAEVSDEVRELRQQDWLEPLLQRVEALRAELAGGQLVARVEDVSQAIARIDAKITALPDVVGPIEANTHELRALRADVTREVREVRNPDWLRPLFERAERELRDYLVSVSRAIARIDAKITALPDVVGPIEANTHELRALRAEVTREVQEVRNPDWLRPLFERAERELRDYLVSVSQAIARIDAKITALPDVVGPIEANTHELRALRADVTREVREVRNPDWLRPLFERAERELRDYLVSVSRAIARIDAKITALPDVVGPIEANTHELRALRADVTREVREVRNPDWLRPLFERAERELRDYLVSVSRAIARIDAKITALPDVVSPIEANTHELRALRAEVTREVQEVRNPDWLRPLFEFVVNELRTDLTAGRAQVEGVAEAVGRIDEKVATLPDVVEPIRANTAELQALRSDFARAVRHVRDSDWLKPLFDSVIGELRTEYAALAQAIASIDDRVAAMPDALKPVFEWAVEELRAEIASGSAKVEGVAEFVRSIDRKLGAMPNVIDPLHTITAELRALRAEFARAGREVPTPQWLGPLLDRAVAQVRTELAQGRLVTKVEGVADSLGRITLEVQELRKRDWLEPLLMQAVERLRVELATGPLSARAATVSETLGRIEKAIAAKPDLAAPLTAVTSELRGLRTDIAREFEDLREPNWIAPLFERHVAELRTELAAGRLVTKVEAVTTELQRLRADMMRERTMPRQTVDIEPLVEHIARLTNAIDGQRTADEQLVTSLVDLQESLDGILGLKPSLEGVAALSEPLEKIPGAQVWFIVLAIITNLSVILLLLGSLRIKRVLRSELTRSARFEGQVTPGE